MASTKGLGSFCYLVFFRTSDQVPKNVGYGTCNFRVFLETFTVKVVNFDHLATFKIILKIFPNSFLTIFLHENDRVLWYFWDPNLKTRFGSQKNHIF